MKTIQKFLRSGLLVATLVSGVSAALSGQTGAAPAIEAGFQDFGINNADTVLTLDCNEFSSDPKTALFYADFRKRLRLELEMQINSKQTEQVMICKEGTRYNEAAGIMAGYDPGTEQVFAEITDSDGGLHRVWAGDKLTCGEWVDVVIEGEWNEALCESMLSLSVRQEGKEPDVARIRYAGPVIPFMASREATAADRCVWRSCISTRRGGSFPSHSQREACVGGDIWISKRHQYPRFGKNR